jgi:hypothetical protein
LGIFKDEEISEQYAYAAPVMPLVPTPEGTARIIKSG